MNALNKNNADFELGKAQKTLIFLYKESLKIKDTSKKKSHPFSIYLGDISDLADGTLDDRVLDMKKRIFKRLQKEKIIGNFKGPFWESECPGDDECNQNCYITGEYYPNNVLPLIEKLWKPKKEISKEIRSEYRKLISLVKKHFSQKQVDDSPEIEEYNRESNKQYLLLSKKIKDLFKNLDSSLIKVSRDFLDGPYIPFANLFSALKELRQRKMTLRDAEINMVYFYGKLEEIENSFDIANYRETEFDSEKFSKHMKSSVISSKINIQKNQTEPVIKTPIGTKWSDIIIKWLNGNDVEITLRNDLSFKETKDYKELGFYDEKRKYPNIQWRILENASRYGNKLSWANLGGTSDAERLKKIDNFQKQISLLRKELITVFGNLIGKKHEPFISFSKDMEYLITLNLISEKGARAKKKESWKDLMSEAEIDNYEQMAKKDFIKNMRENGFETSSSNND